jgi:hypothetical protein
MRYLLTPARITTIKTKGKKNKVLVIRCRNWNSPILLVVLKNSITTMENSMAVPQKMKKLELP